MLRRPIIALLVCAAGLIAALAATAPAIAAKKVSASDRALQRDVLRTVNKVRARHRLPRLRKQPLLARGASAHSAEQLGAGRPSHHGSDGTPFARRLRRYTGARTTGETIAWITSADGAATVVRLWMASPSHRRVLLDRRFRRLGVGSRSGVLGGFDMTVVTANFASSR